MVMMIKVKKSSNYNDDVLINLKRVTLIKPYRAGTRFYFGKDDILYVAESFKEVNRIIQGIYE